VELPLNSKKGQLLFHVGARAWFNAHKPENIILKSGSTETRVKYIHPDWNRSVFSENKKEEVIETDILCNGIFGFMTRETQ
jgi:hypothetical protein